MPISTQDLEENKSPNLDQASRYNLFEEKFLLNEPYKPSEIIKTSCFKKSHLLSIKQKNKLLYKGYLKKNNTEKYVYFTKYFEHKFDISLDTYFEIILLDIKKNSITNFSINPLRMKQENSNFNKILYTSLNSLDCNLYLYSENIDSSELEPFSVSNLLIL